MLCAKIYYRVVSIILVIVLTLGLSTQLKSDSRVNEIGFTVQEIVDALKRAQRTIEDAEITSVFSSTVDLTGGEKTVQRRIEELNQQLKQSKNEQEQKRISRGIQLHKDWLKLLPKWPVHSEDYITFKVPQGVADDELPVIYERGHSTDKRVFKQRPPFESLYHYTGIVSREHTAYLRVSVGDPWERNVIGNNDGSVEKSKLGDESPSYFNESPYDSPHLYGRVRFKIDVNQVKKVYKADSGLLVLELDLGTTKASGNRQLHQFLKLWINPEEGFSVVREEERYEIDGNKSASFTIRNYPEFKEYPSGVWYPTSFEYTLYTFGGRIRPTKKVISEFTVIIKEADFNIGVPEEFFEFTLEEMKQTDILLFSWYEQPVFPDMDSRFPRLWDIIR